MAEELKWDSIRKDNEWKHSVAYLGSMGLPKSKLALTRKDVESGHVGKYTDEDYQLYARHGKSPQSRSDARSCSDLFAFGIRLNEVFVDKPDELLESDSKYPHGSNPMISEHSQANK